MPRCGCDAPQKKTEQAEYHKLLMSRLKEQRERRSESLAKVRVYILHKGPADNGFCKEYAVHASAPSLGWHVAPYSFISLVCVLVLVCVLAGCGKAAPGMSRR